MNNSLSISINDYLECCNLLFSVIQALIEAGLSFFKVVSYLCNFIVFQCLYYLYYIQFTLTKITGSFKTFHQHKASAVSQF